MPIKKEEVLVNVDDVEVSDQAPSVPDEPAAPQEIVKPKAPARRRRSSPKKGSSSQADPTSKKSVVKSIPAEDKKTSLPVKKKALPKKLKKGRVDPMTRQGNRRRG